jgi:hypothetical protein
METTVVINHDCISQFQDKVYGKNRRLANVKKSETKCTCTVCGKEADIKGGTK